MRSDDTNSSFRRCVAVWRPRADQGDGGQDGRRAGSRRGDHGGRGRTREEPQPAFLVAQAGRQFNIERSQGADEVSQEVSTEISYGNQCVLCLWM